MKLFKYREKKILVTMVLWVFMWAIGGVAAFAQQMPVHFKVQQKQVSPSEVDVVFTASIDKGGMSILQAFLPVALTRQRSL